MVHEGHRKRMYEKLASGGLMLEHERLEMLLFNAYPRKNTNPIAHNLLNTFGSVRGVLEADLEELTAIDGVGESVALYLKCVAACSKPAYSAEGAEIFLKNYGDFKKFAARRLRAKTEEVLEIYLLDKSGKVKYIFSRSTGDEHSVSVKRDEIPAIVASVKPYGMLIAHNHLTGDSNPSEKDDKFTSEMCVLCNLSGVILFDHCVYAADNNVFSYFNDGKMDELKEKCNINSIINGRK